jgi:hypothetical protein
VISDDYENQRFYNQQSGRPKHRPAPVLFVSKANISLEAAPGLGSRLAAVGVGPLYNRADCRSTDPRAPVAQSLNLL